MDAPSWFRVGAVLVQPHRLLLTIEGEEKKIEPRQMEVLVKLAKHAGKVFSTEDLLVEFWSTTYYGDNPVHKAVSQLRTALGDNARAPRHIETIPKRGYRLIAEVVFPEGYRPEMPKEASWAGGNPYIGLTAFDSRHSTVFCGRSRATADLLQAMRAQIDQQRRFVLIAGASGCGKTSLLHAGAMPRLREPEGFDGLRALTEAHCDLAAAQGGDVVRLLATALSAWSLGGRAVFTPGSTEHFETTLPERPESATAMVEDALRRHADRKLAEQPHAHLLLTIDHSEALVASDRISEGEREDFWRVVEALCNNSRALVIMLVRSDFYPKLIQAIPGMAERKGGNGHLDLLRPLPGEITQMIREPAYLAAATFEEDERTRQRLDDVVRDAAVRQPDALPLLQHALHALFERRREATMTFAAYREIGGLEGAIAHRAEEVFAGLSMAAQSSLDRVLSLLAVVESDSESLSARHVPNSALADADAGALVDAFIRARLFVGDHDAGHQRFGVAHEALLRQWPRATKWVEENRQQLQSRARLKKAAERWVEEGRGNDRLLGAGRPMDEAREALKYRRPELSSDELAFFRASEKQQRSRKRVRNGAVAALILLTVMSSSLAVVAILSRSEAEKRARESRRLADYMLGPLADELRRIGNLKLLNGIGSEAAQYLEDSNPKNMSAQEIVSTAKAARTIGEALKQSGNIEKARASFAQARSLAITALSKSETMQSAVFEKANAAFWLGSIEYDEKRYERAREHWIEYRNESERLVSLANDNPDWQMEESYALSNLGSLSLRQGDPETAIRLFDKSTNIKQKIVDSDRKNLDYRFDYIDSLSWQSSVNESMGRLESAAAGYDRQIEMLAALITEKEDNNWKLRQANYLQLSARIELNRGNTEKARSRAKEGIAILEPLTRLEPSNDDWARNLARGRLILAETLRTENDEETMKRELDSVRSAFAALPDQRRSDPVWRWFDLRARFVLAETDKNPAVDPEIDLALEQMRGILRETGSDEMIRSYAAMLIARGKRYAASSRPEPAKRAWADSSTWLSKSSDQTSVDWRSLWVEVHTLLGRQDRVEKDKQWLASIGYERPR